jgi:hypothetical protein
MLDHTTLTQLDEVLPGPGLAALLAGGAPAGVGEPVAALVAWQRLDGWVQAGLNTAILAVAGKAPRDELDEDWGREEVAAALCLPAGTTADRIEVARRLRWPLTATGRALAEGRITLRHATEICKALTPLDDDLAVRAEMAILAKAPGRTAAQLARIARREAIKHDPAGADERHKKARATRRVEFTPLADGMAELRAILPADAATRLRAAIDQLAGRTRTHGDPRGIDQRRADALLTLADHSVPGLHSTTGHPQTDDSETDNIETDDTETDDTETETGRPANNPAGNSARSASRTAAPPRVAVIAPLATLTGHADLPGELVGYGPIPPPSRAN